MCHFMFHIKCLKMTEDDLDYIKKQKLQWKCNNCTKLIRSSKSSTSKSPPITPAKFLANNDDALNNQSNLCDEKSDLNFKINQINDNMLKLAQSFEDVKVSMFSEFKKLEDKMQSTISSLKKENAVLKEELNSMVFKLDLFEQSSMNNSIDIIGLPLSDNVDDLHLNVKKLFCDKFEGRCQLYRKYFSLLSKKK